MTKGLSTLGLVPVLIAVVGCGTRRCDPELTASGSYQFLVVERYEEAGRFFYIPNFDQVLPTCAGITGIAMGTEVTVRATGTAVFGSRSCEQVAADIVGLPAPAMITGANPGIPRFFVVAGNLYASASVVAAGGCSGNLILQLFHGGAEQGLYSPAVPPGHPPAVLNQIFIPTDDSCQQCGDSFVVEVSRK